MSVEFEDLGIKVIPGRKRWATTCPECSEGRKKSKAPCLTVNNEPGNRWWKCNHAGCNFSGNLDVFDKYNPVRERSRMPEQEREFTAKTREYITGRGLSPALLKRLKIYETTSKKANLLCFPYFMNVTLVNVKFLNLTWSEKDSIPKWFQLPKDLGTRIIPFGMQDLSFEDIKKKVVIITEGEIDTLTWKECGYNNAVSVPQGAPSENSKDFKKEFAWLQDPYVRSVFEDVHLFYLSVDADPPGELLRRHLAMILGKERCRIVRYPPGYKDINEVFNGSTKANLPALKKEGVDDCFKNVASIPVKGIIKPFDVQVELDIIRTEGFLPGLGCGIKEIDKLYTAKSKHIQFVTGVPGSGKSVYVRWWLPTMVQHNADLMLKWAMFTPENRPVSREYAKMAEAITGESIRKNQQNSMSEEKYRNVMKFMEKHFSIISPDRMNYEKWDGKTVIKKVNTLINLLKYIEYLKKTENIYGYVIDAWNKIEHEQPKYQTDTNFISEQLDMLIDFNEYWDLHGIIIVHPRKIEMSGHNYKMPSLYDIKGSSAWKEKADIGIVLHRYKLALYTDDEAVDAFGKPLKNLDEDQKWYTVKDAPTILRTEKVRFEEEGREDRVRLKMGSYGRFYVDKEGKTYKDPVSSPKMAELPLYDDVDDDNDNLPF